MYDDTRYTLQDQKTRHRLGHKLGIDGGHRPSALWLLSMQVPSSQSRDYHSSRKFFADPSVSSCARMRMRMRIRRMGMASPIKLCAGGI